MFFENVRSKQKKVDELAIYSKLASEKKREILDSREYMILSTLKELLEEKEKGFLCDFWIDAYYEPSAIRKFLNSSHCKEFNGDFVQIGGCGLVALCWILLGGKSSILITPSSEEREFFLELARIFKIEDQIRSHVGYGEALPLNSQEIDYAFIQGSLHHMQFEKSLTEISRILRPDGCFFAVEALKAPGYALATHILGKRDEGVHCKILDRIELASLMKQFPSLKVEYYGSFIRYAALALKKLSFDSLDEVKLAKLIQWFDKYLPHSIQKRFGSYVLLEMKN